MIRARFRLSLPDDVWIAAVSTSFPDATFRLLAGVPMGDAALELGEVLADDPEPAVEAIDEHPDVSALETLHVGDSRAITQYEVVERRLYEFLWESSLPPEFPLVATDGTLAFDVTGTRDQFDAFGEALDATGLQYELVSVVHTDEGDPLLTDRQREFVTAALRAGYFEVPRDSTLAELAGSLGVDKSTASETIRRGTARIVDWFVLGREPR